MQEAGLKPVMLATFAAVIWGLWWVPLRWLETQGLGSTLGSIALNGGAFAAAAAWVVLRGSRFRLSGKAALGAALTGAAIGSYSVALVHGEVVRAILLFYLAPAWSKIIEWLFLGRPWRWTSSVAVVAALTGAVLVLGGDVTGGAWTAGDTIALASGVFWAIGAALIFTAPAATPAALSVVTALTATLIAVPFAVADATGLPPILPVASGMAVGAVYALPIMALTLWSARVLPPATLTFLLTAEILMGVFSSVLFLGEPFGPMRALGAALVILGALSEVLPALAGKKVTT